MEQEPTPSAVKPARVPWNKGKLVGAKPPLRPSHVWSIRTKLQIEGKKRDLALFNLAIDSKLRGCDVVAVRVDDVAPSGYSMDRATIRQKKTGRPVRFELTDQTRHGHRRLLEADRPEARPVPVRRSWRQGWPDDPAVCAARAGMGGKHRARSSEVRHALVAADQGGADLPANGQPQSRPTSARTHDILPANTLPNFLSPTGSILASARP